MDTSEKIKLRRKELKLTLNDLSEAVGVAISTIQRWERGETDGIKLPHLESLASVLKVRPEYLVFDDFDMEGHIIKMDNLIADDLTEIDKEIYQIIPTLTIKNKIMLCNYLYDLQKEN